MLPSGLQVQSGFWRSAAIKMRVAFFLGSRLPAPGDVSCFKQADNDSRRFGGLQHRFPQQLVFAFQLG